MTFGGRQLLAIAIVLPLLGLVGCSTAPSRPMVLNRSDLTLSKLYQLPYWKAEGRIGIKAQQEAWSANLFWEHEKTQDRLRLSGPFNQGVVSIILQNDLIYINEGNGRVETTRDPGEWLRRRFGFEVPVESLRFWMLGLPAPEDEYVPLTTANAEARSFNQRGWQALFERFKPFAGDRVPQKISLQGHQVKLKLVVDAWSEKSSP